MQGGRGQRRRRRRRRQQQATRHAGCSACSARWLLLIGPHHHFRPAPPPRPCRRAVRQAARDGHAAAAVPALRRVGHVLQVWVEPAAGQRGGQGGDGGGGLLGRVSWVLAAARGRGARRRVRAGCCRCGRGTRAAGTVPVPHRSTCALAAAPHRTALRAQDAASGRMRFVSSLGPSIVDLAVDELVVKVGAGHRCRGVGRRLPPGLRLSAAGGRGGRQIGRQSGWRTHACFSVHRRLARPLLPTAGRPARRPLARSPAAGGAAGGRARPADGGPLGVAAR